MILLVHDYRTIVEITNLETNQPITISDINPSEAIFLIAKSYPNKLIIWCQKDQKDNLNISGIKKAFHLKNMIMSYSHEQYLPLQIGYVEDSPFHKINRDVKYPTWLMSSQIGVTYASNLSKLENFVSKDSTFDYLLNSIAKIGITKGVFCYSEPKLLKDSTFRVKDSRASIGELFKFVKQHYRVRWIFLLFINLIWYDKNVPLISLITSFFYKRIELDINFETELINKGDIDEDVTIDVIIPTMGRKSYLYDVLKDLSVQTFLPKKVVVIEQNADKNSSTELNFIREEEWPFKITHKFIHQTGVCNARNLALKEVTAKYVYLADDDNKFNEYLLERIIQTIETYKFDAISLSYLKKGEIEIEKVPIQWPTFGGGCSVIRSKYLKEVAFDMGLEFGYGEDADFGMQLRNCGSDIIYFPDIKILHLRAPIGGFRTKFVHPWENDEVLPKPSPTVMLNRKKNSTKHQLLGYKTILFFKFFGEQYNKNPFSYYKSFRKQWRQSVYWANKLNKTG